MTVDPTPLVLSQADREALRQAVKKNSRTRTSPPSWPITPAFWSTASWAFCRKPPTVSSARWCEQPSSKASMSPSTRCARTNLLPLPQPGFHRSWPAVTGGVSELVRPRRASRRASSPPTTFMLRRHRRDRAGRKARSFQDRGAAAPAPGSCSRSGPSARPALSTWGITRLAP